ncbi:hypothetical protein LAZ67_3002850, partial [Cordylochernes scorpioides]
MEFLQKEAASEQDRALAGSKFGLRSLKQDKNVGRQSHPAKIPTASGLFAGRAQNCIFCNKDHKNTECLAARGMSIKERRERIKDAKCCFSCLQPGHISSNCRRRITECIRCKKKHLDILCPHNAPGRESVDEDKEQVEDCDVSPTVENGVSFSGLSASSLILLQTLKIKVEGATSAKVVRALLDTGSQRSYILSKTAQDLGLSPIGQESLKHVVFGGHTSESVHQEYRVNLGHASGNFKMVAKLLDQQKICGCDVLGSIFMMKSCVLSNGLTASQTRFGWTLMGECQQGSDVSLAHHVTTMTISECSITNLWNIDVLGIMDPIEVKQRDQRDALARRHFLKTVQHSVSGRYVVSLPWTVEKAKIADNTEVAMKRLEQTTKKLICLNLYEDYDDIFRGWLDDGIIEKVPAEQHDAEAFYLPHRPVVKLSSGTTPIRPVFDASSKVYRSPSLNDCLEKGPNLIEMIPNLMLRFRNGKFEVVADIKKAFLQIEVNERDSDYLRFLWYSQNGEKTEVFRHRRVVFGVNCSPFILGAVIEYHLSNVRPEHKPLAQRLQKSFYVDNLVISVNSFEELQDLKLTATSIMDNARMELSRWEHSLDVASHTYPFERAEISKVLGICWDKREDCLSCEISVAIPPKITKRTWTLKLAWDDELDRHYKDELSLWFDDLQLHKGMAIPRNFNPLMVPQKDWQIPTFVDASSEAYAAVVFLRTRVGDKVEVHMMAAKSRVAPLKRPTIPRLELLACVVEARLNKMIFEALDLKDIKNVFWSDATTALAWIKRDDQWGTFVGNRVKEICRLSDPGDWRYVPSEWNPADLPFRGCSLSRLIQSRWWEGPSWLKLSEEYWPSRYKEPNEEEICAERKKIAVVTTVKSTDHWHMKYFSSFIKNVRMMAWIRRFINNLRSSTKVKGELSVKEIDEAELALLKLVQAECFPSHSIPGLKVCEVEGILRVKTKLIYSSDEFGFRLPVLLHGTHPLIEQMICDSHVENCHAGVQFLMNKLRGKYWIVKARQTIKKIVRRCVTCRRFSAKPVVVEDAPLPATRVHNAKVFEVVGIDLAGPLYLKDQTKTWVVLFTCAVYRCVHLELVISLSTEDFLMALERFIKRRGRPSTIFSDNGTNFVGANNFFKQIDWERVSNDGKVKRIEWKFIPPTAAWWGGCNVKLTPTDGQLMSATNQRLENAGTFVAKLRANTREMKDTVYVVHHLEQPLLAVGACEDLQLVRRIDLVNNGTTDVNPEREFPKLFEGLGLLEQPYHIKLKEDNSCTLQHGAVDKSIELKQINSTLSRMEGIKPPAEFVPYSNEKKWETWRESFEIFAIAVNLESMPLVRQRAILKHIAGEKTVMIYKTFHISENDTYPNVKEMLDMLTNHFKPFKNTIQRRNAFFTCVQKERQGIMEFVTELKHLAQECEFENLTESLIRDRLIIGILDREVKRKLLEDPQLTLPRAISIAVISESTCSQVASLKEQKMIEKIEKRNWVKDRIGMENVEAGPRVINPRRERIIEPCKWCGQRHNYGKCPAYGKKCNACGKTNHFSVVCRTKRIRNLLAESEAEESCDEINLNEVAVKTVRSDKWSAVIIINGKKTTVHLDTGAQINVLPHKVINQWPSRPEIRPTSLKAFAYGNTELPIVGKCNVLCQYGEKKGMFEFIVADVEAQTLITGDTCEKLEILRRINHINTDEMKLCSETQKILEQYHEVFQGVGLINSECKIYTKPEYSPVQVPPRRIPTSLGAEVQSELEKMVKQGIVTKIYHETEWSHPMVVVKKKSGQIRICLDPRKLNEALVGRHFQTPAPAELLHEIPKAKYYTVLDVKSAYWHIPVAKECRDLLVMTTPFGKFRYNRLPFGLKISAQIFVEKMTNIFRDSFQNITYVDDLLIYADTIQEHNKKLKGILEKAKEKNIKFDLTKAQICLTKVRFLGHVISQNGIDPEPNKIDKLITFKRPEDKKSLQRIMGLYNYLGKFIPNLAASTSNIRGILRKNVVWHWGPKQDGEFDHIKECVRNAPSLAHFDKSKVLILQCDASKDAMGAALLQEDRPLAFASASFSDSQKQYSQIEKELLSVYYGCKKFEYLLSGHPFVVQTDHQPLLPLVKKPLSDISPRLQRLVMKLIAFDFKLQYKPGKYLIVADTLSRDTHPMDELPTPFLEDKRMVKMVRVNISDEKLVAMQKDTREDPALVKVIDYVIEGWPICKKDVDEDVKVFFDFRHRLYLWNDLLCIGSAIVIPKTQRNNMLNLLHQSHQGISAIQGLARESLFWPRMSIDIAEKVKNCEICQKHQKSKIRQPLKPFPVPDYPWQTVSLDIFYIQKKPHLLVVDRYSGYPEVFTLDPPTASNVKNKLRETFARFGIPETMMSDNGPPFRSEIMTDFCIRWGIKQLFSSPHLHRSNGLAERNIQTIKTQLIKCRDEGSDPYLAILAYRNTPKNDLPSPAQLCLSRSLRCQIPRITPLYRPYQTNWRSIENSKRKRQSSMKEQPRDGGYEKSQLSSEPITASPEAQHPQCDSPTMGESSTAPIQRSSEETNIDQREGATTSAGIAPEPSGRSRFS